MNSLYSHFLINSYREKIDTENREDESKHRDEEILPLPSYLDDVMDEDARAVRPLFYAISTILKKYFKEKDFEQKIIIGILSFLQKNSSIQISV